MPGLSPAISPIAAPGLEARGIGSSNLQLHGLGRISAFTGDCPDDRGCGRPLPLVHPRNLIGVERTEYTVPISWLPKLGDINRTSADPLDRFNAVMNAAELFTEEPIAK
jgi:hypothetical protein